MEMKLPLAAILMAALTASAYAQDTAPDAQKPGIAEDEKEIAAWIKEARERLEAEIKEPRGRPLTHDELLRIESVKDYPASVASKPHLSTVVQRRSDGTVEVAAGTLPSAAEIASLPRTRMRSDAELKEKLGYVPADISRTAAGAAELLTTEPTGKISNGKSSGVVRTYLLPGSGILVVSEEDYVASQTRLTLIRETLNTSVNGVPARSSSATSKDGRGKTELRWVTPQRSYWLTFITDDSTNMEFGEKLLRQVAQSISI